MTWCSPCQLLLPDWFKGCYNMEYIVLCQYILILLAENASCQCLSPQPLPMQLLKDFSVMLNFMTFHPCPFLMTLKNSLRKENSFKHGQEWEVWLLIPWGISLFFEDDTRKNLNPYSAWMICLPEVCLNSWTLLSIRVLLYVCICKCSSVPLLCPSTMCSLSQTSYERFEL